MNALSTPLVDANTGNFGAAHSRVVSPPTIAIFFVLAFALTWGRWAVSARYPAHDAAGAMSQLATLLFSLSFAAVAVVLMFGTKGDLRRWLRQCLRWRGRWRWYAVVLLAPPLIMLSALGIHAVLGGTTGASPVQGHVLIAVAQVGLVMLFGGPVIEEFGWRGYALPALTMRIGWRWASLVVGVAWGLWHVPLFYMAKTAQADLPIALFLASTVALSVAFARLSVNTGFSIVPAILLHTAINWWSLVLPVMPKGGDTQVYSIVMALVIAIGLVALLLPGPRRQSA